jgi:hypothetical protein
MSLKDEIIEWTQPNGLVSTVKYPVDDSTGNGLAYTALYYWLLFKRGEARDPSLCDQFNQIFIKCLVPGYYGLINRSPTKLNDQDGWDDYVCLSAASGKNALNVYVAERIYLHGRGYFWVYNNVTPCKFTFQSWLGRSLAFVSHVKSAVGVKPNFIERLVWAFSVALSGIFDPDNATSRVLSFLMIETMNEKDLVCLIASKIFFVRLKKKFPGGMKEVVAKWIGAVEHPIVKYWPENL